MHGFHPGLYRIRHQQVVSLGIIRVERALPAHPGRIRGHPRLLLLPRGDARLAGVERKERIPVRDRYIPAICH